MAEECMSIEGVIVRVYVGDAVAVGARVPVRVSVAVGTRVPVGVRVLVGVNVLVGVIVIVGVEVIVAVRVIVGVGGIPVIVNKPLDFQASPAKICTSYVPGSHWSGRKLLSVYPNPPDDPFQGIDSYETNSPSLNHKAVHWELVTILSYENVPKILSTGFSKVSAISIG